MTKKVYGNTINTVKFNLYKTMKGVLIEIGFEKPKESHKPAIKARLEDTAKQFKELKLKDVVEKLEHAESNRNILKELKKKRLHSFSLERQEKVKRKYSNQENEKEEQKEKLASTMKGAEMRRAELINKMINKLKRRNERIILTNQEMNQRKDFEKIKLRLKIDEKMEETGTHREKMREDKVKKLDSYNSRVINIAKVIKEKKENKIKEMATSLQKKILKATEKRQKHLQDIKVLAKETAGKPKKVVKSDSSDPIKQC